MTSADETVPSVVSRSAENQNGRWALGSNGGGEDTPGAFHALGRGDSVIIRVIINNPHRLRRNNAGQLELNQIPHHI